MAVYFIRAGRTVKIGYTAGDPMRRLRELQTANHRRLTLLAAIPGGREDEARFHQRYSDERITGEWFTYSRRIKALVRSLDGLVMDPPSIDDVFLDTLWVVYPDVTRGVEVNAASCAEILDGLHAQAKFRPETHVKFAGWDEQEVADCLHAAGIPTKPILFWETAEDAWNRLPGARTVWEEGVELDAMLEYFRVERGTYWDGTPL